MEHRLCLGDFLDPASSSNQDQVNVVVELNTLKEKFAELEQTKSVPVEQKQKGKKKDKVKKKDKKGKNQADLFKKLNENLALTCTLYNQVYLVKILPVPLTMSLHLGSLFWVFLSSQASMLKSPARHQTLLEDASCYGVPRVKQFVISVISILLSMISRKVVLSLCIGEYNLTAALL